MSDDIALFYYGEMFGMDKIPHKPFEDGDDIEVHKMVRMTKAVCNMVASDGTLSAMQVQWIIGLFRTKNFHPSVIESIPGWAAEARVKSIDELAKETRELLSYATLRYARGVVLYDAVRASMVEELSQTKMNAMRKISIEIGLSEQLIDDILFLARDELEIKMKRICLVFPLSHPCISKRFSVFLPAAIDTLNEATAAATINNNNITRLEKKKKETETSSSACWNNNSTAGGGGGEAQSDTRGMMQPPPAVTIFDQQQQQHSLQQNQQQQQVGQQQHLSQQQQIAAAESYVQLFDHNHARSNQQKQMSHSFNQEYKEEEKLSFEGDESDSFCGQSSHSGANNHNSNSMNNNNSMNKHQGLNTSINQSHSEQCQNWHIQQQQQQRQQQEGLQKQHQQQIDFRQQQFANFAPAVAKPVPSSMEILNQNHPFTLFDNNINNCHSMNTTTNNAAAETADSPSTFGYSFFSADVADQQQQRKVMIDLCSGSGSDNHLASLPECQLGMVNNNCVKNDPSVSFLHEQKGQQSQVLRESHQQQQQPPPLSSQLQCQKKAQSTSSSSPSKTKQSRTRDPNEPKRPLTAYNYFFKYTRADLLGEARMTFEAKREAQQKAKNNTTDGTSWENNTEEAAAASDAGATTTTKKARKSRGRPHRQIGFEEMAQQVSRLWQEADAKTKLKFKEMADQDRARYETQKAEYLEKKQQQQQQKLQEQECNGDGERTEVHEGEKQAL